MELVDRQGPPSRPPRGGWRTGLGVGVGIEGRSHGKKEDNRKSNGH